MTRKCSFLHHAIANWGKYEDVSVKIDQLSAKFWDVWQIRIFKLINRRIFSQYSWNTIGGSLHIMSKIRSPPFLITIYGLAISYKDKNPANSKAWSWPGLPLRAVLLLAGTSIASYIRGAEGKFWRPEISSIWLPTSLAIPLPSFALFELWACSFS